MNYTEYVVVYDITNNRERRKLSQLLTGFGFRIQKSVFECRLSKSDKRKLVEKIQEMPLETGWVKMYRRDYASEACFGKAIVKSPDQGSAFIV